MRILIFAMLSLALLIVPIFGQDQAAETDMTVYGGVELCGPIGEAVEYLAPKKGTIERSAWEKINRENRPDDEDVTVWKFGEFTVDLRFAGQMPDGLLLMEYEGSVKDVIVFFYIFHTDDQKTTYREIYQNLTALKGDPDDESTSWKMWIEGNKRTAATWSIPLNNVSIRHSCISLDDAYKRNMKSKT